MSVTNDTSKRGGISAGASSVITGGRSVVSIAGSDGVFVPIGIFDSCTVSESLTSEDIHILGAFAPQEITLTAYNAVSVQCSGFRVYGYGVKYLGQFPTLAQLLGLGPVIISITDREQPGGTANGGGGPPAMTTIAGCLPDTNSTSYQSRATSKINITYKGKRLVDESSPTDSELGAVSLP